MIRLAGAWLLILVCWSVLMFGAGASVTFAAGMYLASSKMTFYCQNKKRILGIDGKVYYCAPLLPKQNRAPNKGERKT